MPNLASTVTALESPLRTFAIHLVGTCSSLCVTIRHEAHGEQPNMVHRPAGCGTTTFIKTHGRVSELEKGCGRCITPAIVLVNPPPWNSNIHRSSIERPPWSRDAVHPHHVLTKSLEASEHKARTGWTSASRSDRWDCGGVQGSGGANNGRTTASALTRWSQTK